jgi:hypothetical protein
MAPRPTVIGSQGYRRGLASLSVVKELLFRVHRNVPYRHIVAVCKKLRWDSVWWDLSGRVARPCLPALLTSASAEFLPRVLVALRLASNFLAETRPLVTRH